MMNVTKPHAAMKRLNDLRVFAPGCWIVVTKPHAAMKRLNAPIYKIEFGAVENLLQNRTRL